VAAALLIVTFLVIPLTLPARSASPDGTQVRAAIVATSVPEAFSLLLLGTSLAGLGAVIRRRLAGKRNS
jgi:hypothetical protein